MPGAKILLKISPSHRTIDYTWNQSKCPTPCETAVLLVEGHCRTAVRTNTSADLGEPAMVGAGQRDQAAMKFVAYAELEKHICS